MRNVIKQKPVESPFGNIYGRAKYVSDIDIKGKKVLDLGCGFGWCEINFLKRGVREIVGLDNSAEVLSTARKYIKNKRAKFIKGQAYDLPFKNASFDTTVSWEMIEHVPHEKELKVFKEAGRVLKKKGKFYVSTPFDSFWSKITDPAWWVTTHRHYSVARLSELAEQSGFDLTDYKVLGGIYSVIYSLNMYFSKWILRRKPLLDDKLRPYFTNEYDADSGYMFIYATFTKK